MDTKDITFYTTHSHNKPTKSSPHMLVNNTLIVQKLTKYDLLFPTFARFKANE